MIDVEMIKPTRPEVRPPIKMASAEFTVTFPSRIVHRRRLPFFLKGRIFLAYSASSSSYGFWNGGLLNNSRFLTSSPSKPRFRPEKRPDMVARTMMATKSYHCGPADSSKGILHVSVVPSASCRKRRANYCAPSWFWASKTPTCVMGKLPCIIFAYSKLDKNFEI